MARNKLYLTGWDFNKCILCDKIEQLAKENGAILGGYYHPGIIHRRYEDGHHNDSESRETEHCDTFGSSTQFSLNGNHYYVEFDDNPFFDFHYHKIALNDKGNIVGSYYCEEFPKSWFVDELFSHSITETELDVAAKEIYDLLINAKYSEKCKPEKKKIRVGNIYDNGFHYEYIYEKEKESKPTERKELNY